MAANKIYIQVDFQSQTAQGAVMDLNKNIEKIGATSQQATAQAAAGAKGFSVSLDQVGSSAMSAAQALAGMGLAATLKEMIGIGAELQRIRIGFDNIADGAKAWSDIHDYASLVGADFKQMVTNANELHKAGRSISQATELLKAFQDQAVHTGASQEQLNEAVSALARISAGGYVQMRAIVGFKALGLEPGIEIAKRLGISIQELRHQMGEIKSEAFIQLVLDMARAQSAGEALTKRNELLTTAFNDVKNALNDASVDLVKTLQPAIQSVIKSFIELIKLFVQVVQFLAEHKELVETAATLVALAYAIGKVQVALTALSGILAATGAAAGEAAIGMGALEAVMLEFGPAGLIVGGLYAAYKIVQGIHEEVTHEGRDAAEATEKQRKETLAQVEALEEQLATLKKIKLVDVVQAGEANLPLQALTGRKAALEAQVKALQDAGGGAGGLLEPNYEELKRQAEVGANILLEAQRKYHLAGHESIQALTYEYEEHFKKVAKSAQGTADVQMAAQYALATIIKKRNEEMQKENEKVLEETVSMTRKVAVAAETLYADPTFAGRRRQQELMAQDEEAGIRDRFRLRQELAVKTSDTLISEAQTSKLFKTEEARAMAIAKLQKDKIDLVGNLEILKDQTVYEHRLKHLAQIHQLEEEERKKDREEALADQLDFFQKTTALRIESIRAETAQTLPERIKQIRAIHEVEVQGIEAERQARIAAVAAELADYKQRHVIGVAEAEEDAAKQAILINRDAQAQIQADRLNAWKEANDAIIEEQRKVYDSLRGAFDKIWGALTDRSKSVWANIGNALRTALTDAVKQFVTSRAAAAVTEAFTGRGVTFEGGPRGLFGNAPKFEGLGRPPAMEALIAPAQGLGVAAVSLNSSAISLGAAGEALGIAAGYIAAALGGGPAGTAMGAIDSAIGRAGSAAANIPSSATMAAGTGLTGGGGMLPGIIMPTGGGGGGAGGFGLPGMMPGMQGSLGIPGLGSIPGLGGLGKLGGLGSFSGLGQSLGSLFGIGGQVATGGVVTQAPGIILPPGGIAATVPWAQATLGQKFGSIMGSQGMSALGLMLGSSLAMGGLQRGPYSIGGNIQAGVGGAIAGAAMVHMLAPTLAKMGIAHAAGLGGAGAGAAIGGGLMLGTAGLQRGGLGGAVETTAGGALVGAGIGFLFGGVPGALLGAAIGAGAGAIAGGIRAMFGTWDQQLRDSIKRVYNIDISNKGVRDQIGAIIKSKYGGSISLGVYSSEVQEIIRLYRLSQGAGISGLPRPEYPATFAQSGAGGLQLQPVYSGGQLVQSPYSGITSAQYGNYGVALAGVQNSPVHIQLNPQQAFELLNGRVVQIIGNNPDAVAAANTNAAVTGSSRTAQSQALLEPLTVSR